MVDNGANLNFINPQKGTSTISRYLFDNPNIDWALLRFVFLNNFDARLLSIRDFTRVK
jgi:hypothetical protein